MHHNPHPHISQPTTTLLEVEDKAVDVEEGAGDGEGEDNVTTKMPLDNMVDTTPNKVGIHQPLRHSATP